ncbi:SDR family oxidoreductase [Hoyosella subflava]|uniref:3-alpha-(Or 20-beta)-hydroxysteroid dehydrogenase n=1 Tax=Hoyosella subflava (strain DSM 45089 / JCM 17490 / NBRC 109087 / DQS3-9A1) TaxID=443218 RepID=F6EGQ8_HOYSD|nr:SDR family oxidoreductase [Hoyosella subflava]AEF42296.1 3-alpha-(Or 20-beta)-hydroxysteroid dehydrogenase [Hoyosella subflava DQS3-9A1]
MALTEGSVLVTGGARGIGAAIARSFCAEGRTVVISDILDEEGAMLAEELGDRATYVPLDVRDESQWAAAIAEATKKEPLAVLVNNAGVVKFGGIEEQSTEEFRFVLDVNLVGAWLGMRAAAPSLRASRGVIINISSTAGMAGYSQVGSYVASKWAMRGLTKTAALEFAPAGIRVFSVHPGPIRTPMTAGFGEEMVANQPIPRFGEPDEVADLVVFLAHKATFATGSEFLVDGGALTGVVLTPPE